MIAELTDCNSDLVLAAPSAVEAALACVIIRIVSGRGVRRGQLKPLHSFCLN